MRFLSLFSGIEAASVAWSPLGWQAVAFAEIEPFPCAVLAHHYPGVPNLGDVTQITDTQIAALGPIDLVCGGSPCQDLSVAGKRKGLSGERSSLFHEQIRIFNAARNFCGARWLLWENVPGAFSSNAGKDFAVVVGAMAGCHLNAPADGWGSEGVALGHNGLVEWAVLDAQWFGLAQRRRRVFAVLDTGDWACRPPILLERDSLRGDTAPIRESGQSTAPTLAARTRGGGGLGTDFDCDGGLIPACLTSRAGKGPDSDCTTTLVAQVAGTLNANGKAAGSATQQDAETGMLVAHSLRGEGFDASEDGTGRGTPLVPVSINKVADVSEVAGTLCRDSFSGGAGSRPEGAGSRPEGAVAGHFVPTAYGFQPRIARNGRGDMGDVAHALNAQSGETGKGDAAPCVATATAVRRLLPEECEALQGFSRGYTRIPWRGKPADQCPDGPRYKALGNSWATTVAAWIGKRIALVEAIPARQTSERSLERAAA